MVILFKGVKEKRRETGCTYQTLEVGCILMTASLEENSSSLLALLVLLCCAVEQLQSFCASH